jgi:hypothetical protein
VTTTLPVPQLCLDSCYTSQLKPSVTLTAVCAINSLALSWREHWRNTETIQQLHCLCTSHRAPSPSTPTHSWTAPGPLLTHILVPPVAAPLLDSPSPSCPSRHQQHACYCCPGLWVSLSSCPCCRRHAAVDAAGCTSPCKVSRMWTHASVNPYCSRGSIGWCYEPPLNRVSARDRPASMLTAPPPLLPQRPHSHPTTH